MASINSIRPMIRKMSIAEIKYLNQLIKEELGAEESIIWLTKLQIDEGTTEDDLWDLIWDLDEDFAESLESGWEDRKPIEEDERKRNIQKRHTRIRKFRED